MDNFVKNTLNNTDLKGFGKSKSELDQSEKPNQFDNSFKYSKFSPFRKDNTSPKNRNYNNPYPKPPQTYTRSRTNQRKTFSERNLRNMKKRAVCNNCGIQGHLTKECEQPIQSYGLIILNSSLEKVLLIQRRDSFGYISLINNERLPTSAINRAAKTMTQKEHQKIACFDFNSLWKDIITDPRLVRNNRVLQENEERFKSYQIRSIVNNIPVDSLKTDNEWGFPKGRIKKREKWIDCAKREASEETGISANDITIISDMPFMENIKGFDGRMYINVYYVAQVPDRITEDSLNIQKQEIQNASWVEMEKIEDFFSATNMNTKKKLIRQIKHYLKSRQTEENDDIVV